MAEVVQLELQVTGAGEVEQQVRRVQNALGDLGASVQQIGQIANLGFLSVALREVGRVFGTLSGVGVANEYERLAISFRTLTGDAASAAQMLERVRAIAAATKFDTNEVAKFSRLLAASGLSGETLFETLERTLDLTAALGVAREDFERFTFNLMQLRSSAATDADVRQLLSAAPAVGRFLGEQLGLGRTLTMSEISTLLSKRGGEGFFELLMQVAESFEGASKELTPLEALANLREQMNETILPTGQLFANLLALFTKVLTLVLPVLSHFNRVLRGVPGALLALSAAALALAATLRAVNASSVGRAFTDTLAGLVGLIALLRGQIGRAISAVRTLGLSGLVMSLWRGLVGLIVRFRVGLVGLGLGLLGDWLGGLLEGVNTRVADYVRDLGAFGGIGATIGAGVGSIIPGLGTLLGGLIGGAIGVIAASIKAIFFPAQAQASPQQQIADNTARMAQTLEAIRVEIVGAGRRAGAFRSRFEAELAVQRILGLGVG